MAAPQNSQPITVETDTPDFKHSLPMLLAQAGACVALAVVLFVVAVQVA
ncbi:MAG: hypothetical protein SF002_09780 [Alphaproteobacteria bacterium]|nr:hypothetical protein [Alphaproteobacteria bacterium]